jgi:hypothetical protein
MLHFFFQLTITWVAAIMFLDGYIRFDETVNDYKLSKMT